MSADNWEVAARRKEVEDAYGKVDRAAYSLMVIKLEQEETFGAESRAGDTFREDYEMGMTREGRFYVRYRGHCTTKDCGFSHEFKTDNQLKV